jgi:putative lipoic acid-binding regulatory protein
MRKVKRAPAQGKFKAALPCAVEAAKNVDLKVVEEEIARLVRQNAVDMVEHTIQEVCNGHYPAMRYLFEMAGLRPKTGVEDAPQEDSLARTLLERLQLLKAETASSEVEGRPSSEGAEQESGAVK